MRQLLLFLIMVFCLSQPCHGLEDLETLYPDTDIAQAKDFLTYEVREAVEEYNIQNGQGVRASVQKLTEYLKARLTETLNSLRTPFLSIFFVIILCSVLEPLFYGKTFPLHLFGCLEILRVTLSDSQAFFREAVDAISSLYDFSTILLPCLAGTSVIAGASVSAGVKYTAAALFMNLLLNFSGTFLIPIISVYLISIIGTSVFDRKLLASIADFIRWGCKTTLTATTVIFTAYLNIAGLITGTSDMFAVKLTKTAINSALPVVGSIISGAASSLVAGAAILRNSIGIFGLLSVLGILIAPLIHLLVRYLLFVAAAHLANFFPNRQFFDLLNGIAGAFGMMLGVIGTGFIMVFLTLISFMQIVGV